MINNQNLSYKLDIYNFEYLSNGGKFSTRSECIIVFQIIILCT